MMYVYKIHSVKSNTRDSLSLISVDFVDHVDSSHPQVRLNSTRFHFIPRCSVFTNIPFYKYTHGPCHSLLWTCEQRSSWIILCFMNIFFQTFSDDSRLFCGITKRAISVPMGVKQIHVSATYNFDLNGSFITLAFLFIRVLLYSELWLRKLWALWELISVKMASFHSV